MFLACVKWASILILLKSVNGRVDVVICDVLKALKLLGIVAFKLRPKERLVLGRTEPVSV